MAVEFFNTMMGKKYYEHDVPQIAKALNRIADALENQNQSKEMVNPQDISEDEDGNKYEILWGNNKPFKSGDMAYNPMSGIVIEVYFDADDEYADDEYYVQENYAQVKKYAKGEKIEGSKSEIT